MLQKSNYKFIKTLRFNWRQRNLPLTKFRYKKIGKDIIYAK